MGFPFLICHLYARAFGLAKRPLFQMTTKRRLKHLSCITSPAHLRQTFPQKLSLPCQNAGRFPSAIACAAVRWFQDLQLLAQSRTSLSKSMFQYNLISSDPTLPALTSRKYSMPISTWLSSLIKYSWFKIGTTKTKAVTIDCNSIPF